MFVTLLLGVVFLVQRYGARGVFAAVAGAGAISAILVATSDAGLSFRGLTLLQLAVMNPALLLQDASLASRVVEAFLGIYSLFVYPFGTGSLVWLDTAQELGGRFDIGGIFIEDASRELVLGNLGGLNEFARHLSRMGIWFLAFPWMVWVLARDDRSRLTNVIRIYILFPIAFAMPFSFPGFWFLLGTRGEAGGNSSYVRAPGATRAGLRSGITT